MGALPKDPNELHEVGWGVVFESGAAGPIREALGPLLALRHAQSRGHYREFEVRPGETVSRFLSRHGVSIGGLHAERVPYYLLIAGSPLFGSFEFQRGLDVKCAVGRLHFNDMASYARYASLVVDAERSPIPQSRQVAVVSPRFPGDDHTAILAEEFTPPLVHEALREIDWRTRVLEGPEATKASLLEMFRDPVPPAVLVTATHSVIALDDAPWNKDLHGAPICQEWPGPQASQPLRPESILSGEDVQSGDINVRGLMALLVGSFTAGCDTRTINPQVQARAFVSGLSQSLLAAPRGGALAVIGFVDRLLSFSYRRGPSTSVMTTAIIRVLRELCVGHRVGHAAHTFDETYAEVVVQLNEMLEIARYGSEVPHARLGSLWAAANDLRSISVIGDPAVRLPAAPVHVR